jgi:hypothetical protein
MAAAIAAEKIAICATPGRTREWLRRLGWPGRSARMPLRLKRSEAETTPAARGADYNCSL